MIEREGGRDRDRKREKGIETERGRGRDRDRKREKGIETLGEREG